MLKLRPPDAFFDFFDQLRADGFCGGRGPEACASRSAYTPDAVVGTLGEDRQAQQKGDGWMDVSGRVNVSKFLSQHPGRELTIWAFAENDSTTEFNMIYLLNGDQKHTSDVSASCHGQGRCGCQFGGLERLLLAYGVKGK